MRYRLCCKRVGAQVDSRSRIHRACFMTLPVELLQTGPEHADLRSELTGIDAWELADLFVLKKYRRQGVGLAVARRTLCQGQGDWLVRCYREDAPALAFCQAVLGDLPRPVREIVLDDEPLLCNFLVTQRLH
ncbi:hypothetical protein WR25_04668 [Diploscapter pachys]|uniref:Uncharacterized protein n=1 Tax=Diploscapter pachys TaxID=2018661 RepID=A0A2A2KBB2_9BILA|nr:hypothetical protein WR25_04668 [Diploscapter pachys]